MPLRLCNNPDLLYFGHRDLERLWLKRRYHEPHRTSSSTTPTDASVNYSFTGLSNGSYTVTPSKTGYTFAPTSIAVTISGANQTGKNFTATATGTTCSVWTDVTTKYNDYVSGQATWTQVIDCYTQYVAAHP